MNTFASGFKALSDLTRMRALRMILLSHSPVCVCELSDALRLPQYQVSKHLAILRQAGLVTDSRVGTWVYYSIPEGITPFNAGLCRLVREELSGAPFENDEMELKARLARRMGKGQVEVFSAGLEPKGLHPISIKVMGEIGIDISGQTSKIIDPDLLETMDVVITLCGDALDRCPVLPPGIRHIHWPLPDPAAVQGSEEEIIGSFREVRAELQRRIADLLKDDLLYRHA